MELGYFAIKCQLIQKISKRKNKLADTLNQIVGLARTGKIFSSCFRVFSIEGVSTKPSKCLRFAPNKYVPSWSANFT